MKTNNQYRGLWLWKARFSYSYLHSRITARLLFLTKTSNLNVAARKAQTLLKRDAQTYTASMLKSVKLVGIIDG